MTTYFIYSIQPYGVGENNPNAEIYWDRAAKSEQAGGEPCAICGRKVNTLRAKNCMVDVQDATFTGRILRPSGSDCDLRLSFVGPECHSKYVIGSFEVEDK